MVFKALPPLWEVWWLGAFLSNRVSVVGGVIVGVVEGGSMYYGNYHV